MAFEYNDDKKETGVNVVLQVPGGGGEVAVTSASFSEEVETSEVQFNNSFSQNVAVTGITYSGSFEVAGRADVRERVFGPSDDAVLDEQTRISNSFDTTLPRHLSSIVFIDGEGTEFEFNSVLITSHSKDIPADDRTTQSFDFTAERLVVNDGLL